MRTMRRGAWGGLLLAVCGLTGPVWGGEESGEGADADLRRVVALIDGHIESRWRAEGVTPADPADDAEFLRRASLDINGRIPSVAQARAFLADDSPDKREELIDRLLEDPRYAVHFTHFWRKVLIPEVETDFNTRYLAPGFEAWLRTRLLENTSYRAMVREILDADVSGNNLYQYNQPAPAAFYAAKEIKPENLAAATSRMFLGVRIECAQCHDHPFDDWTRRDFWGVAAFFGGMERARPGPQSFLAGIREFFGQRKIRIPDTDEYVDPTYLDGTEMARGTTLRPRQALTDWIVQESNPYFARMAVNRMWGHLFGTGFVDPVDDFSDLNPPSHPELLDELAGEFVEHNYDLKFLIRCMTLSRGYGLSSRQTDPSQAPPQRFAKMAVKGLTPEQMYDSLLEATGGFEVFSVQSPFVFGQTTPRGRFDELFADTGTTPTSRPTTVLQSLAVMNGEVVAEATHPEQSGLLAAVLEYPGFDTAERVETIFLAALSRRPTPAEREKFVAYVERSGTGGTGGERAGGDKRRALSDVFWVLLNSSEFRYNH